MSRAVVLVWLGSAALRPAHEPDLQAWSQSRQLTVEDPAPEEALPTTGRSAEQDELVTRIETLLAEARTAGYSTDPAAAERALSSAELLVRGNPELPEAAWLMAETCAEHAALARATDPALADILERRALVLGGARARAFTEGAATSVVPPSQTELTVEGPLAGDAVFLDGQPVATRSSVVDGEHHLRVERRGRLAWSGWITTEANPVHVPVPGVAACTATDLEGVRVVGDRVVFDGPVRCPEWALAREAGPERIEVAMCRSGAGCGPFLPWSRSWGEVFEARPVPRAESKGNPVLLWTAIGVGVVLAGTFAAWEAGAFDREGPPRTTFRFTGPGNR